MLLSFLGRLHARGTSRRTSDLVAAALAVSPDLSVVLLTARLDSNQPIAPGRSPGREGDQSSRRGGNRSEQSQHLQHAN